MKQKPYYVAWTRQGETIEVYQSDNPQACIDYAKDHIVHGHTTERIDLCDRTGPLERLY